MIEIRELMPDEVQKYNHELQRYMYMVLSENGSGENFEELSKKYYQNMVDFSKDGTAILIGAWDGAKLIGFHWGYEIAVGKQRRIHSYFNAIELEYRGQKIGSQFFRKLEEISISRGIYEIEAMCTYANKGAVDYHLKNGFEIERLKVVKSLKNEGNKV